MIDAERVQAIFMDCLFRDGEDASHHVEAEGLDVKVGFHPGRLQSHRDEIEAILGELPKTFREKSHGGGGDGWSFINACMGVDGKQWGGQADAERLLLLGIGISKVRCQFPREVWELLPGRMPYYVVLG